MLDLREVWLFQQESGYHAAYGSTFNGVPVLAVVAVCVCIYWVLDGHRAVPESARAHSYYSSRDLQETCSFRLLSCWLLT